jgi:hypothetical protein
MLIGCEDFPKSEQGKILIEDLEKFINDRYKYSAKQLIEAFTMASTYELYLDGKRVDPSTFGKHLSRASVGKILTAYREHLKDSNARPSGYNRNQLPEAPVKKITPAEAWDLVLKWFKEEGQPPQFAPYLSAYEYLLSNNQVKPVKHSTKKFGNFDEECPERLAVERYLLQHCK